MSHKHWELVEANEPKHGKCANCGFCSCCGRGATPVVYPYQPYYPTYPYITWGGTSGGTVISSGTTTNMPFIGKVVS